jgi:hypothetical protein
MQGKISLKQFIEDVKKDIFDGIGENAPDPKKGQLVLNEVTLDVAFQLNMGANGSTKLLVLDAGMQFQASQVHRVILKMRPEIEIEDSNDEISATSLVAKLKEPVFAKYLDLVPAFSTRMGRPRYSPGVMVRPAVFSRRPGVGRPRYKTVRTPISES